MNAESSVVHLNVPAFPVAVALSQDRGLADRPVVAADPAASRALVFCVSSRAWAEGLRPLMPLAQARLAVPDLRVIEADAASMRAANEAMESIARRYAPLVQNDSGGHLYLDLAGTRRLFGDYLDTAVRVRREIARELGLEPTLAVARNKLVAKVAARSLGPAGLARVRADEEAAFLAPQDVRLLSGVGPAVYRILAATGIVSIGELAALNDAEALALLGRRALFLRDAARGLDESPVSPDPLAVRRVRRRLDFASDALDALVLRGALVALVEDAGVELRASRLCAARAGVQVLYADGVRAEGSARLREAVSLDRDLLPLCARALERALSRRVRVRSLHLELSELAGVRYGEDLFEPEGSGRQGRLQEAIDASRTRFGPLSVTRAVSLLGSGGRALLPSPCHA